MNYSKCPFNPKNQNQSRSKFDKNTDSKGKTTGFGRGKSTQGKGRKTDNEPNSPAEKDQGATKEIINSHIVCRICGGKGHISHKCPSQTKPLY